MIARAESEKHEYWKACADCRVVRHKVSSIFENNRSSEYDNRSSQRSGRSASSFSCNAPRGTVDEGSQV